MLMLNLTNTSYLNVIDQAQLKTKFANLPYYLHIMMNRLFCKGISQTEVKIEIVSEQNRAVLDLVHHLNY